MLTCGELDSIGVERRPVLSNQNDNIIMKETSVDSDCCDGICVTVSWFGQSGHGFPASEIYTIMV
jgi:hypothetical protein